MRLLDVLRGTEERFDPFQSQMGFGFDGSWYPVVQQSMPRQKEEHIDYAFTSYAELVYQQSGPVFSVMAIRRRAVSQARFSWQQLRDGRVGDLFSTRELEVLRRPWQGGTSADLIGRAVHSLDLAGNAFIYRRVDGSLKVLRPDWVTIVRAGDDPDDPDRGNVMGYVYTPGGWNSGNTPVALDRSDVAHWAGDPDPMADYRGMSWIRPVVTNVQAHKAAATHKDRFFRNSATPNIIFKFDQSVPLEKLQKYQEVFEAKFAGADNAYKAMWLGGGGDPVIVGSNLEQISLKEQQGTDETMIAAAGGVPPIIAGFSEGLESATYSNYGMAKEHFRDTTVYDLLQGLCSSLETIVPPASDARLWFDLRDIPFFRDDARKEAEIVGEQARAIRTFTDAGYTPESAVAAVQANDMSLLEHTGLFSVQLQPPGAQESNANQQDL